MNLDDTLRLHALKLKAGNSNSRLADLAVDQSDSPDIKQMCAKVSVQLSDEIDQVCQLLDLSKRSFIELACIDALEKAHKHLDETGALEAIAQRSL